MFALAAVVSQASPAPSPTPRYEIHIDGSNVFIDQATAGAGQVPPEGAAFIAGSPAAPLTPYDWFSTMPLVPGVAGSVQYALTGTVHRQRWSADASVMLGGIGGDPTNAVYWGEPLLGPFDPLEGRSILNVPIAYPTHAGASTGTAGALVLPYSVDARANDNRWRVAGGYVQTSQYDPFVFVQPPYATFLPSMNVQVFESAGPGLNDLSNWSHLAPALPMLGADASATIGRVSVEATDALLPGPPNTAARMTGVSVADDAGARGRFSADVIHVSTRGDSLAVPTLFGANATINPGAQGPLALGTIADQSQTIAGVRAFVHPHAGYDATAEFGRSWYDASQVARPGTNRYGDFEHLALARHFNAADSAGIEYYRMDARYAPTLLPYGTALNVWGIAWAYPGPWLKGTYQLVNNAWGGSNREGLRVHGAFARGPWRLGAAAYDWRQIEPSTYTNLTSTGFVEVDYLVLARGDVNIGHTRGVDAYLAWSGKRDTISFDYASDMQHRDCAAAAPVDCVAMRYPQLVAAEQHTFAPHLIGEIGYGRYAAAGSWATTPVDATYAFGFAGVQADLGRFGQVFVQYRNYGVRGAPSIPGGPPPTLTGSGFLVDQHFSI
ncbi:MAG TPA: hypothetical protein VFN49_01125 [Candidatus Aquilonibacter sp.]|nr:hypothetical protein [Candidatus Aquilonibacter sp.]